MQTTSSPNPKQTHAYTRAYPPAHAPRLCRNPPPPPPLPFPLTVRGCVAAEQVPCGRTWRWRVACAPLVPLVQVVRLWKVRPSGEVEWHRSIDKATSVLMVCSATAEEVRPPHGHAHSRWSCVTNRFCPTPPTKTALRELPFAKPLFPGPICIVFPSRCLKLFAFERVQSSTPWEMAVLKRVRLPKVPPAPSLSSP